MFAILIGEAAMSDTPTPTPTNVPGGFADLARALAAVAVSDAAAFTRAPAFRQAVLRLAERWDAGQPPHTVRGTAGKAGA